MLNRRQCAVMGTVALGVAAPRRSAELARVLAGRPNLWLAHVTGAPPGKERCSSTGMVSFFYGGKQWLQNETVPDFFVLAREPRMAGWCVWRGYVGNDHMRRDRSYGTLRQARNYASSLTGGLMAPWIGLPQQTVEDREAHEQVIAFAKRHIAAEQQA